MRYSTSVRTSPRVAHRLSASALEGVGVGPPPVGRGNPVSLCPQYPRQLFISEVRNHNQIGVVLNPNPTDVFNAARHANITFRKAKQRLEEVLLTQDRHESGCLTVNTHGTPTDLSTVMVARITRRDNALEELEDARRRLEDARRLAELILYGRSGHGGIAREKPVDADCIYGYYVMGMEIWVKVASELVQPSSISRADAWCRMRAKRALLWADKIGVRALVAT